MLLYLQPLTKVEELFQSLPLHFVCQPGLTSNSETRGNQKPSCKVAAYISSSQCQGCFLKHRLDHANVKCYVNIASTATAEEEALEELGYHNLLIRRKTSSTEREAAHQGPSSIFNTSVNEPIKVCKRYYLINSINEGLSADIAKSWQRLFSPISMSNANALRSVSDE
uniref:Uncharacterized protein n=1 Tax=Physcomitrium patens TaxID=3218 RepID=A0A2K1JKX3_PHYPA|nr:hypothetical protein PHYPA_017024 [Physcomitrium patens]